MLTKTALGNNMHKQTPRKNTDTQNTVYYCTAVHTNCIKVVFILRDGGWKA